MDPAKPSSFLDVSPSVSTQKETKEVMENDRDYHCR